METLQRYEMQVYKILIIDKGILGIDYRKGYLYPRYGTITLETINSIRSQSYGT